MKCRAASGCELHHSDDMVCCRAHWFKLPKPVRDEIEAHELDLWDVADRGSVR